MTFLANSNVIMQISHGKTFKARYTRCQYRCQYGIDKYGFICGSIFYETDVITSEKDWKDGFKKWSVLLTFNTYCIVSGWVGGRMFFISELIQIFIFQ